MDNLLALPIGTELAGDFRITKVLGAGGFGITYLADETPLNRGVAIKEYFPSDFAAREGTTLVFPKSRGQDEDYRWGLDRFIEEAQTLATFDHANIVRVYRYFRQNNTGYMVLKLEEGTSFKAWLDQLGRRPSQAELDNIVRQLLDALGLIHDRAFLHRDIAPDNIMIRPDGSPVLIDFGSARREVASHLATMSVLVKPGYSPAEQYAQDGKRQGPWTDMYALAATLYHAVTGRRPADAPGRMQRDDLIPAELAAPQGVYRDDFLRAIDMALRLPIEARPQSIAAWRTMLFAGVDVPEPAPLVPMPTLGRAPAQTRKIEDGEAPTPIKFRPRPRAEPVAASDATIAAPGPMILPPEATPVRPGHQSVANAGQLDKFVKAMAPLAAGALLQARSGAKNAVAWLREAMPRKVTEPPKPERRGLIDRLADAHAEPTMRVPDPETKLLQRDVPIVVPVAAPVPVAPLPEAKPARVGDPLPARIARKLRGLLLRLAIVASIAGAIITVDRWGPAIGIAIPRGDVVASSDVGLVQALRGHAVPIEALTITSDGALIASAGTDGQILVWDAKTGKQLRGILEPGAQVTALASSEHVVLAGLADGSAALWNMDTGEKVAKLREHEGPVRAAAFLGSSREYVTTGQDSRVRLWNGSRVRNSWSDHKRPVYAVAYSAYKRSLVTGGADKTLKLWDEKKRKLVRTYQGHTEDVRAVAIAPDGGLIASAGNDRTIRLWATSSGEAPLHALTGHTNRIVSLAFSPDGRMLASGSEDGTVRLWDAASGKLLHVYEGHVRPVRAVAFLPTGHRLASAGDDMTVRIWNARIAGYP